HRHLGDEIGPVGPGSGAPPPRPAGRRPEMLAVTVIDQCVEILHCDKDYRTTLAAVAAVGAAEFDEFLAAKARRTAAAVAAFQIDLALVEKLHRQKPPPAAALPFACGVKRRLRPGPAMAAGSPTHRSARRGQCETAPRRSGLRTACGRGRSRHGRPDEIWCRAGAR